MNIGPGWHLAILCAAMVFGTYEGKRRQEQSLRFPRVYANGEPVRDDSDCEHDFDRGALAHCKHCGLPWNGGADRRRL